MIGPFCAGGIPDGWRSVAADDAAALDASLG
jgi:hypothetical protein